MAEIAYTVLKDETKVKVIQWPNMANGDTGQALLWGSMLPDKCVEVDGTFGSGGTCKIQGSNKLTVTSWKQLRDPAGSDLTFTAEGAKQVLENPYQIRPEITAGDGTTALTVTMTVSLAVKT